VGRRDSRGSRPVDVAAADQQPDRSSVLGGLEDGVHLRLTVVSARSLTATILSPGPIPAAKGRRIPHQSTMVPSALAATPNE